MGKSIILASSSPRRHELLAKLGIEFEIIEPTISEIVEPGESAWEFALRVAGEKALSVVDGVDPDALIIGADTVVSLDDHILLKPKDYNDAERMLKKLSGTEHNVYTAFAFVKLLEGIVHSEYVSTRVTMRELAPQDVEGYIKTGEPMDKAGAYSIQGLGATMVRSIKGSYTNVVGLPLVEVMRALAGFGIEQRFTND